MFLRTYQIVKEVVMIIIPARIGSTRFPKKILTMIGEYPMVVKTAKRVQSVDDVVVATDSQIVIDRCKEYDIKAYMTSENHQSGTDRINEISNKLKLKDDEVIINVQADEPFIEKEVLIALKNRLLEINKREFVMASCAKSISVDEAKNPNIVKVLLDNSSDAIYFSRSVIPYDRDNIAKEYLGHIGIYGFNVKSLREFCNMNSSIEHIEKLEQLRVIENSKKIAMIKVNTKSFGIDTKEDLEKIDGL